jgi:fermentation-respiration switch protein FrsA (DUF1100 family)
MIRYMLYALGVVISGYILLCLMVYIFQSYLVYFPVKMISETPRSVDLAYEEVNLTTQDGIKLHGWYIPSDSAGGILLFCHGNAGNIGDRLESIKVFHDLGLSVLIFDYRGFGQSEGRISESGSYLDAHAAWEFLTHDKRISSGRIFIFGRSLGSAVAAQLACTVSAAGLILESGFSSIPELGQQIYPYLPVKSLSRIKYPAWEYLSRCKIPVLIIHSRDDEIIPFSHGQHLYTAASEPKYFIELSGSHNEGFLVSGPVYTEGLGKFVSEILATRTDG